MHNWGIHNCVWDAECRAIDGDPPNRVHVNTPWGQLIIALRWSSRTQAWLPFKGYTTWWSPIVWHPRSKR